MNIDYTKQINSSFDDALFETVAKPLQEEIDWDILCDLLKLLGWHKAIADSQHKINDYAIVKAWVYKNIKGDYKFRLGAWIFKHQSDAVLFSLKWS